NGMKRAARDPFPRRARWWLYGTPGAGYIWPGCAGAAAVSVLCIIPVSVGVIPGIVSIGIGVGVGVGVGCTGGASSCVAGSCSSAGCWRHAANISVDEAARTTKTERLDRKSTRLNSSHVKISYAVFCLKKKNDNIYYH